MSTLSAGEDLAFRLLAFQWLHRMSAGGTRPLLRQEIEQFKGHAPGADFPLIRLFAFEGVEAGTSGGVGVAVGG